MTTRSIERLPLREQVGQRRRRAHVVDHDLQVERQLAARHLLVEDRVDQHLLGALRVLDLQRHDVDVVVIGRCARAGPRSRRACSARRRCSRCSAPSMRMMMRRPRSTASGSFDHHAVIAGQVRLALAAVEDHELSPLALGKLQLDVAGEGGAAQADQSGLLDARTTSDRLQLLDRAAGARANTRWLAKGSISITIAGVRRPVGCGRRARSRAPCR